MALITIEYGSLANSDTMNKNFLYLDNKMAEINESIQTSISSIHSNIATINARINEVSESIEASAAGLNANIEDYRTKTKSLVDKVTMIPNWSSSTSISLTQGKKYTAPSNGYILVISETIASGNLTVNGKTVVFKIINGQYDNAAQLVTIPVYKGDVASTTVDMKNAYFIPAKKVSIENF